MADSAPPVTPRTEELGFERDRVAALLKTLEIMAAGHVDMRLPISTRHDALDAIAHGINVLVGELAWAGARAKEAQDETAAVLRAAVADAERANAAKSVFLSNITHEIRTPIAAMLGFADLLESDLSPEARADLVRRLRANGKAVLSVLGNLLDLARLDAHKIELIAEEVSVVDVVCEVLASVEIEANAKGLGVRAEFPRGAASTMRSDPYRLRQILVNLLANALKFTSTGGIFVSVHLIPATDGDQWAIDVADTGIGIASERHQHVFELFEQADPSIGRNYGGVGLGLALSRRMAEHLGGSLVLLRSVPGEGTTFRLTLKSLPLTVDPRSQAKTLPSLQETNAIDGLRVLLAEDHADIRLAVQMLLEQAGASVELADDGREAVTKALADTFDVVLMDLRMPHLNGLDAARLLRAQGSNVPIVALTADPAMVHRAAAIDGGCDECLSKPFLARDLVASIRALHDRRRVSGLLGVRTHD
jgi:signal transduction histidine kinase/ActR/RegA family two-component response regulator